MATVRDLQGAATVGLPAVLKILDAWGLNDSEQMALLGLKEHMELTRWRSHPPKKFGRDQLERLSHLLGIYRSLHVLLPDSLAADGWIQRPNSAPLFGGQRAFDLMANAGIPGLLLVRQYLNEQVGACSPPV